MEKNEGMLKFDLARDKTNVNPTTLEHMKVMERYNLARVRFMKRNRRHANLMAAGLVLSVCGTYLYSMYAVRQEAFLDDFEEPKLKSNE